jgi:hypothetical protein
MTLPPWIGKRIDKKKICLMKPEKNNFQLKDVAPQGLIFFLFLIWDKIMDGLEEENHLLVAVI